MHPLADLKGAIEEPHWHPINVLQALYLEGRTTPPNVLRVQSVRCQLPPIGQSGPVHALHCNSRTNIRDRSVPQNSEET